MTLARTAALLAGFALAACSAQQTTSTGFLERPGAPTRLAADPDDAGTLAFVARPAQLAAYRAVLVEPVVFRPGPAVPAAPDAAVVADLTGAYSRALAEAFAARGYRLVAEPEPGTLRIRAAVTGFERANVALNVVTTLIVSPVTGGGAASEAEVLDAVTGERLVALATNSNASPLLGGPHNYFREHGHARAALSRHARALAARLPEASIAVASGR